MGRTAVNVQESLPNRTSVGSHLKDADNRHATLNVLVERAQAIVGVFYSSEEPKHTDTQQFIHHQPRKKVSLKTIAILLSNLVYYLC